MRLRTFTAPDMPSAMKMVREAMGEDAIIVASQPLGGKSVSVTAALEMEDDEPLHNAKPFEPLTARDSVPDDLRYALQTILRFHNVPELFIAKILQKASEGTVSSALAVHRASANKDNLHLHQLALEKLLEAYFSFKPLELGGGNRLMLIGTPGIGKTLTAAKIATRMAMGGEKLVVITTDDKRAGGVEQLQAFTNILGVKLGIAGSRTELWKQLKAIPAGVNVVVDTAGCNPYSDQEWQELQSYATIENIEPVLVMQAGSDSAEAIDTGEIFAALPIKRMLVTRSDTTRRFGGVLAAAAAHGFAFSHTSTAASMADSLHPLTANMLSKFLLRYQQNP